MWPGQALPLLCYMCAPNDEGARNAILRILWSWAHHSGNRRRIGADGGPDRPAPLKLNQASASSRVAEFRLRHGGLVSKRQDRPY